MWTMVVYNQCVFTGDSYILAAANTVQKSVEKWKKTKLKRKLKIKLEIFTVMHIRRTKQLIIVFHEKYLEQAENLKYL